MILAKILGFFACVLYFLFIYEQQRDRFLVCVCFVKVCSLFVGGIGFYLCQFLFALFALC